MTVVFLKLQHPHPPTSHRVRCNNGSQGTTKKGMPNEKPQQRNAKLQLWRFEENSSKISTKQGCWTQTMHEFQKREIPQNHQLHVYQVWSLPKLAISWPLRKNSTKTQRPRPLGRFFVAWGGNFSIPVPVGCSVLSWALKNPEGWHEPWNPGCFISESL